MLGKEQWECLEILDNLDSILQDDLEDKVCNTFLERNTDIEPCKIPDCQVTYIKSLLCKQ